MAAFDDSDLLRRVQPLSKQSPLRLAALVTALQDLDSSGIAGDIVECGTWRGASAIIARTVSPDRTCWLYDTFDGMTAPDPEIDISHLGRSADQSYRAKQSLGGKWAKASREEVTANLHAFNIIDGVKFIEGDVSQTLISGPRPDQIALLRLDTDFYRSTLIELQVLYPRLVPGGVLIIDDYGHWLGCRQAVNEYFDLQPLNIWHWSAFQQIDATAVMRIKS